MILAVESTWNLIWPQIYSMVFTFYRACYGVLRFIMESGAKGCEVCLCGFYVIPNEDQLKKI